MGTELMDRGLKMPLPLWSADTNITHPEFVKAVHIDYVNAGADIICTNTFRTTTWTYRKVGLSHKASQSRARSSLMKAVDLARESNPNILAASLTSIEDCYEPSLYPGRSIAEDTYGENINWFLEAGVDVLLFETMGHIEEIEIALETVKNLDYKIWLSLVMKDKDHILSGHKIKDVFKIAMQDIDCLMLNCTTFLRTVLSVKSLCKREIGSLLAGSKYRGEFEEKVKEVINAAKIIAIIDNSNFSSSGSSPIHINMIRKMIDNFLYQID